MARVYSPIWPGCWVQCLRLKRCVTFGMCTFKSSALYLVREGNGLRLATLMMSTPAWRLWSKEAEASLVRAYHTAGGSARAGPSSFIARTSIKCVSNLPSLPWNITGKVHKIREAKVKPSSVLRETEASSKSGSGGSGGSSNPMSIHPRTKSIYIKKEITKEDSNWTTITGCHTCRKHSLKTLIFTYVWFDTMMNAKEKRREQHLGMSHFQS